MYTNFLSYLPIIKNPNICSMTFIFSRFERLSRYMFVQTFTKLSAAVHKLSCSRRKKTPTKTIVVTAESKNMTKQYVG